MSDHKEIEARFLDIDVEKIKSQLKSVGAEDLGENLFEEMVFYSSDPVWDDQHRRFVRIRTTKHGTEMTYKHQHTDSVDGTLELQIMVSDPDMTRNILEELGLKMVRSQQKKRHSFKLDGVAVDLDSWPKIPTYIELEGPGEASLRAVAAKLQMDWSLAIFENPRIVIEKYYHIPVGSYRYFRFDRIGK